MHPFQWITYILTDNNTKTTARNKNAERNKYSQVAAQAIGE